MPNVTLPAGTAVELYAATGITPGTQLVVSGITDAIVRLAVTQAGTLDDYVVVSGYEQATNKATDNEAWALSFTGAGINIREA